MGRDSEDGIEGIEGIGDKIASTRTPAERNCPPPILSASAFIGLSISSAFIGLHLSASAFIGLHLSASAFIGLSISSAFIGPALVEGVAVSLRRSPCL
jgi:hypothetical protein